MFIYVCFVYIVIQIDPLIYTHQVHQLITPEVGRLMKKHCKRQSKMEVAPVQGLNFTDDGFDDSSDSGLDSIL